MKTLPPILPNLHPPFQSLPTHPPLPAQPHFPVTSNCHLTVFSAVMFLWLNRWSCHIWCVILLNDNMDLYMSSLGTLVPEGPWCVFHATRRQVYWSLTHNVVFDWYSDFISITHSTHNTFKGQQTNAHINIYLHHLLCAHSSYLYFIKWLSE